MVERFLKKCVEGGSVKRSGLRICLIGQLRMKNTPPFGRINGCVHNLIFKHPSIYINSLHQKHKEEIMVAWKEGIVGTRNLYGERDGLKGRWTSLQGL